MEDEDGPATFDREYVQTLRQESAKYRQTNKDLKAELEGFKGLEAQIQTVRIENEFIRRGVQADPSWIKISPGEDPGQAVENFLVKYPQFGGVSQVEQDEVKPEPKQVPKAMPAKGKNPASPNPLNTRSLEEIKKDPVARSNMTDMYRDLLKTASNQKDN